MNLKKLFLSAGFALAALLAAELPAKTIASTVTIKAEPEKSVLPSGTQQDAMIKISIETIPGALKDRKSRVNLAIALDRSGSMHGMNKIENARAAAIAAVNMLGENDRFSLITYDSQARVLIPSTRVTEKNRQEIIGKINAIRPTGMTALFAGVSLAANEIAKVKDPAYVSRIILLSDGQANVGPASAQELGRLGAGLVKEGISVSTVGVGSDYNENLMTALAQNSDGNFYFVEKSPDLSLIFEKELGSALAVAAKSVKIRIVCPQGVTPKGILGHECKINGQEIELDFNQIYAGHSKVLILQVGLPAAKSGEEKLVAAVRMNYLDNVLNREFSADRRVQLAFAADKVKVERSLNKTVSADVALQQSAVLREKALKEADKGNYQASQLIMQDASTLLKHNAAVTNAPAVRKEAEIAREETRKLEKAKAAPSSYNQVRKEIIGNSFQIRNSQMYKQK